MKNITSKKIFIGICFFLSLFLFFQIAFYSDELDQFKRNISLEHFNEGVRLERAGDLEKAMEEYEKSIDADPYNPYPFLNFGTIYFHQGELLLSRYYYLIALKNDPNYENAKYNLDLSNRRLLEKGIVDLEKEASASQEKGQSFFDEKEYKEALREFMRYVGALPEKAEAYLHVGKTLFELKRYSFAERNFSITAEISGTNSHLAQLWAASLEGKGKFRKALEMLEGSLEGVEEEENQRILERIAELKQKIANVQEKVAKLEKEFAIQLDSLSEKSRKDFEEFLWNRISEGTSEDIIREEFQKAFDRSLSEIIFDNGLMKLSFPANWYGVAEETRSGSPIAVFRRWPGDTQLAFYSVKGEGSLDSAIEKLKSLIGKPEDKIQMRDWPTKPEFLGVDAVASLDLDYDFEEIGSQTLRWWLFYFEECKSFCAAAALIGNAGLGEEEIIRISSELDSLLSSIQLRREVWKLEEGIRAPIRIYFPLPPEYAGVPPFSEKDMPWKIIQGPGFTLLTPPGVIGKRMDATFPGSGRTTNVLWLKGEFIDNKGSPVKIGDQEFFGYVDLFELESEKQSVRYVLGHPQPNPPLSDPKSKFLTGEDYTSIAKEAAACDYSWVGKFQGNRFQGVWLIFRMSYGKMVVEFGFPIITGVDSFSIFWIPTTFRVEGMPPAFPPVDAAEKFHISFKYASLSERRDPLGREGELFTPEFSLEIPSGWRPSINYRSIDGYPITLKEATGGALIRIFKKDKDTIIEEVKKFAQKEICKSCDMKWIPLKNVKKKRANRGLYATLDHEKDGELKRWDIYIFKSNKGDVFLILGSIPQKELDSFAAAAIKRVISSLFFK